MYISVPRSDEKLQTKGVDGLWSFLKVLIARNHGKEMLASNNMCRKQKRLLPLR
jgi:hypothetical protein